MDVRTGYFISQVEIPMKVGGRLPYLRITVNRGMEAWYYTVREADSGQHERGLLDLQRRIGATDEQFESIGSYIMGLAADKSLVLSS